jgi:hypothetical protein
LLRAALAAGGGGRRLPWDLCDALLGDGHRDQMAGREGLLDGMVKPCIEIFVRVLGKVAIWGQVPGCGVASTGVGWHCAEDALAMAVLHQGTGIRHVPAPLHQTNFGPETVFQKINIDQLHSCNPGGPR